MSWPRGTRQPADGDFVQVLVPESLARQFEQDTLAAKGLELAGPLLFSEDDLPTYIIGLTAGPAARFRPLTPQCSCPIKGESSTPRPVDPDCAAHGSSVTVIGRSHFAPDNVCGAITDSGAGETWCAQRPGHKGPCKLA